MWSIVSASKVQFILCSHKQLQSYDATLNYLGMYIEKRGPMKVLSQLNPILKFEFREYFLQAIQTSLLLLNRLTL